MAVCRCCCRGKPLFIPSTVTLWKLRVSDLEAVWWQDRNIGTTSGVNINVEVYGEYCVDCGPSMANGSSWEVPGALFTPITSGFPDVAANMTIPASAADLDGMTFSNDGAETCFFDSASGGSLYRFTTLTGHLVSQETYSAPGTINRIYGIAGSQNLIVAYNDSGGAGTFLGVWEPDLTEVTAVAYGTFAPTADDSYQPQAETFAVTSTGDHYLYDSELSQLSTGAVTATETIYSANADFSLARDSTAATYRLLSNTGFGEAWNSAYAGGYTPVVNHYSALIDADGNVFVIESSGANRRIRKLSGVDGTEDWSTAFTGGHTQLLYDPTEDVLLLLYQPSGGANDAVKSYDGTTGTLITSHDMGDVTGGFNSASSRGALAGGYLYVSCPQGNAP